MRGNREDSREITEQSPPWGVTNRRGPESPRLSTPGSYPFAVSHIPGTELKDRIRRQWVTALDEANEQT